MTAKFTVTVRQVLDDGSEAPLEGELAAALAAPRAVRRAGRLGGGRGPVLRSRGAGEVIGEEGRELQRWCCRPRSTSMPPARSARPSRSSGGRDPARHRRGRARAGRDQRVRAGQGHPDGLPTGASRPVPRRRPAGPVRRPVLPGDAVPGGLPPGRRRVRAGPGGHRGPHRRHGRPRPAHRARRGPRGLDDDFYAERARDADTDLGQRRDMCKATARASRCARSTEERREEAAPAPGSRRWPRRRRADFTPAPASRGTSPPRPPAARAPRPEARQGLRVGHRVHRGHVAAA